MFNYLLLYIWYLYRLILEQPEDPVKFLMRTIADQPYEKQAQATSTEE